MEVSELILKDEKWRFNGKFPEHYKVAYGKTRKMLLSTQIWYINHEVSLATSIKKDKTKEISKKEVKERIPEGLYLVRTGTRKDTLNKIYDSLLDIFTINDKRFIRVDYGETVSLFRDKHDTQLNMTESLQLVEEVDTLLYTYLLKIATKLHKLYDTEDLSVQQFMKKYVSLIINKYKTNGGLALHTDNIIRYDTEGPVCVISVGPEFSYIDFAPSVMHLEQPELTPLRIKLPEGSMYIMDGISRLEWSHGVPFDSGFNKIKFSVMFKFSRLKNHKVAKHSSILDTDIYESIMN